MIVLNRLFTGFTHSFKPRKVDNCVYFIFLKNFQRTIIIEDIRFVKFEILSGNGFDTVQRFGLGVGKIVHNNNIVTRIKKLYAGMASDEARSAGDKNCTHKRSVLS